MRLRDHDQPCEHRRFGQYVVNGFYNCAKEDCPGGREGMAAVVPWCAEHDTNMCIEVAEWDDEICRLEEPARHYVIGE